MPQLDFSTYFPQLFWLFFSFALLFILMSYIVLPQLEKLFNRRAFKMRVLLDQAELMQKEAQTLIQQDQEKLQEARVEAQKKIRDVLMEVQQNKERYKQEIDAHFQQKLEEADGHLNSLRKKAFQEATLLKGELVEALFQKIKRENFLS